MEDDLINCREKCNNLDDCKYVMSVDPVNKTGSCLLMKTCVSADVWKQPPCVMQTLTYGILK